MKTVKFGLLIVVAILGIALLGSTPAFAYNYPSVGDSFIVSDYLGAVNGGFNVEINGSGNVDFITFCMETNEWLYQPMIVGAITDAAVAGGVGGAIGNPPHDPLDARTAYLYTMFTDHTLTGFDYTSAADAQALQMAIWIIEEEKTAVANEWVTLAENAILNKEWSGLGDVMVINSLTQYGGKAQDFLTRGVPEPSMMLLFGSGMLGLAFAGRKYFKK